jgi:hypothetical protein
MNAFSKDYKSVIDWKPMVAENEKSRKHSAARQEKLESDDPAIRAQATGNLGVLSGIKANARILKNSKT